MNKMVKILKVQKKDCIGCGACISISNGAFKFDDDGKAKCIKEVENFKEIKSICPVQAIK